MNKEEVLSVTESEGNREVEEMARTVSIGAQDFAKLAKENLFLVDKTNFIREWWTNQDQVTLITRPRRFGKTLNINMVERFFSNLYNDQEELFGDLAIWQDEDMRKLAGQFPVIQCSEYNEETDTVSSVSIDDESSVRSAVEYLVSTGHRQLSYISCPAHMRYARRRLRGFRSACEAAGLRIPDSSPLRRRQI